MTNIPSIFTNAPGLPKRAPNASPTAAALSLTGAAGSWSMSYAPEAPSEAAPEPAFPLLSPAGADDATERLAFALWNEGRKDEAIEFLERNIAREREHGRVHAAPPPASGRFRPIGAGALMLLALAAGGAVWANWDVASSYLAASGDEQHLANLPPAKAPLSDLGGAYTAATPDPAQPSEAAETIRIIEPSPWPAPSSETARVEEATIEPQAIEEGRVGEVALAGPPIPEPRQDIEEAPALAPPPAGPSGDRHAAAAAPAMAASIAAATALPVPEPAAAALFGPQLDPPPSSEGASLLARLAGERDDGLAQQSIEPPPLSEARLPRARPNHLAPVVIAEAPATPRPVVVAEAVNPPSVAPPVAQPYPPVIFEASALPAELAYNRARAERYVAIRRSIAEHEAVQPVIIAPPLRYGRLEIIGRVPGW